MILEEELPVGSTGIGRTLYDLVAADGRCFSPTCWRTTLALAHKGLDWTSRPTRFIDIPQIAGGGHKTVPVLDDAGTVIVDSWNIAEYLESHYPDRPSLFGGETGKRLAWFIQQWTQTQVSAMLFRMISTTAEPSNRANNAPHAANT